MITEQEASAKGMDDVTIYEDGYEERYYIGD